MQWRTQKRRWWIWKKPPMQLHHSLQQVPMNWTSHQWHPIKLNMFGTKFDDAFIISNNYKA
jgi:hypothetical protein